ncbi:Os02g0696600 [Oryza sativa Japonica Group]|uniref:Os02g0696600 protein n=2 Tax=Oryza sativa subsp. japonica TaxID=39947 RepID=Q0DYF9_ORYSJ|nr:Os02g0696600 [Oryza sativa Japonica Group]|eukprot:NP_001047815.2 Os02g0696600 [Oryza sativa Japonica Group]
MYFNSELSWRQNVLNGCQERIPIKQWAWLVRYWKTEAARIKSERNKATRSLQLNGTHTTGSRGFAVVLDQTELKENRKVGRAELYVITHTKRNGEPLDEYCSDKID